MKTETLDYQTSQKTKCKIILSEDNHALLKHIKSLKVNNKIIIITSQTLKNNYAKDLEILLKPHYQVRILVLPDGEKTKNTTQLIKLVDHCLNMKIERNDTLIACGGGVIGDITGFLASILLRGINFIQYPTTLLAQVDAAIGGKTGVNHAVGKNLIGSFYQPKLIWINLKTLSTLPKKEWLSGLAEVIKYGIIQDKSIFNLIEENTHEITNFDIEKNKEIWTELISKSVKIKAQIVQADEKESGLRAILNLGHTVGHAIETLSHYNTYSHGEAVILGCISAIHLSENLGHLNKKTALKILTLFKNLNYKTKLIDNIDSEKIYQSILSDKKIKKGTPHFILPTNIGSVKIVQVKEKNDILNAIKEINK